MVLLALLYGNGDFYKTGQYAMALGYDADCNAATACAVVGARIGFAAIEKLPGFNMPDRYVNQTRPQLPEGMQSLRAGGADAARVREGDPGQRRRAAFARRQAGLPHPAAGRRG